MTETIHSPATLPAAEVENASLRRAIHLEVARKYECLKRIEAAAEVLDEATLLLPSGLGRKPIGAIDAEAFTDLRDALLFDERK